jgi:hypothetical protein
MFTTREPKSKLKLLKNLPAEKESQEEDVVAAEESDAAKEKAGVAIEREVDVIARVVATIEPEEEEVTASVGVIATDVAEFTNALPERSSIEEDVLWCTQKEEFIVVL